MTGRLAERVGWRRVALGTVLLSGLRRAPDAPDVLPLLVLGLACVASAMFAGVTAAQLGISDVARVDRGAATALYFSIYYTLGALGAWSRESPGRHGVGAASPLSGSSRCWSRRPASVARACGAAATATIVMRTAD